MHMRLKGAAAILLHCRSLSGWWDLHLVPQPPCTTLSRYNNLIPQSSQAHPHLHKLLSIFTNWFQCWQSSFQSSQAHPHLHKLISILTNWFQASQTDSNLHKLIPICTSSFKSSQDHLPLHKLIPIFTSSLESSLADPNLHKFIANFSGHFFQSSQTTHSDLHKMIPIFTSSFQFSQAYFNLHKLIPIFTIELIPPILINWLHQSSQAHFNVSQAGSWLQSSLYWQVLVSFELEVGETAISFISSCQNPTHHIPNYVHSMGLVMCESMWEVLCPVLVQSLWGVLFKSLWQVLCQILVQSFVTIL
jgi:uncharacterized protein YjiS (DUF1127 family)